MQDQDHPGAWPSAWGAKLEKVIGLCEAHVEELTRRHPAFADTIVRSRNGLREDLIARMLPQAGPRQPHRLMYASSPDRGLLGLLEVFRTIRFHCRTAELHVYYGFDNMATLTSPRVRTQMQRILARAAQPGVFMHGRTGQPALYQAWLESALYVHPTNFLETGHIALMEAQALGAIPVVNPQWATGEQLLAGIAIEGDGEGDRLQLRRYAHAALYLLQHPELQEEMRASMMAEARKRFGWTGVVEQYDAWAKEGA
jgi:glycosyltransferase involved in cell wall biosynthesis